jgi:hypothetical protein
MKYQEIEELLRDRGMNSAVEQLRSAVGEEALALTKGLKGDLKEDVAVEQAREFYAEDISRWIAEGGDPDPETLIGMRSRYTKSWAFAQIIHNLLISDQEDIAIPDVDADTLVKICLANAELGTKLVELIGATERASKAQRLEEALEGMSRLLDSARAPVLASPHGQRKLAPWERLEALVEELEGLRESRVAPANDEEASELYRQQALAGQDHIRVLEELVLLGAKNLCWMAEKIHQTFHVEEPGSWRECSKGVCGSMGHMLAQVGFSKELEQIERVP